MAKISLLFCTLLSIVSCTNNVGSTVPDVSVEVIEIFDITYTLPGSETEIGKLDLYYVPDGKPKRLMVFIHGGSWVGGDKRNLRNSDSLVQWFLDRDYVVAVPNFRLATPIWEPQEVSYGEQATDIAHALAWLTDNHADYGVTEDGIVLIGYSSGAHLVALLSTNQSYLQSVGLTPGHLLGTISLDVHAYDVPYALQLMEGSELSRNIPLIRFLFRNTEAEQLAGSPSFYAQNAPVPPSLIISADPSDTPGSKGYIAAQASREYVELLSGYGHQATWIHYDDETHASLVGDFGTVGDNPTEAVADFLDSL